MRNYFNKKFPDSALRLLITPVLLFTSEKFLREKEEKLDAMLRSIGNYISILDKDLNIIGLWRL